MADTIACPSPALAQASRPLTPISEHDADVTTRPGDTASASRTVVTAGDSNDAAADGCTAVDATGGELDGVADTDGCAAGVTDADSSAAVAAGHDTAASTDQSSASSDDEDIEREDEAVSSAGRNVDGEEEVALSSGDTGDASCITVQVPAFHANNVESEDVVVSCSGEAGDISCADGQVPISPTAAIRDTATFTGDTIKTPPATITDDICFHVDADLLIEVIRKDCDKDIYFRVSSANFACASTVWRLDLYGSSKLRSSQDDPLPVDIGDSHPDALATLMNIVHYRFGEVPNDEIGLSKLYDITQLTEKFMGTHLIRPWASTWIKNKEMRDLLDQNGAEDGKLCKMGVKIAWELGAGSLLKTMAEVTIMTVIVDEDGDLLHGCGEKLKDLTLPPGMFETISEIRFDIVSKLLAAIRQPYDKLTFKHRFCPLNEHQECDATMLGSLTMQLAILGLFPVPTVGNYKGTLRELESAINSLKVKRWEGKDIFPHLSHVGCNLGVADEAKAAMKNMEFPLEAPYIQHLERQRRLSGISVEE